MKIDPMSIMNNQRLLPISRKIVGKFTRRKVLPCAVRTVLFAIIHDITGLTLRRFNKHAPRMRLYRCRVQFAAL
jgi:hypothetical protein